MVVVTLQAVVAVAGVVARLAVSGWWYFSGGRSNQRLLAAVRC